MAVKKNKKPASLGCLFWIAVILLIIVLFFLKKDVILGVLEKTGALELFSGNKKTLILTDADKKPVVPVINTVETPADATEAKNQNGDGSGEKAPEAESKPLASSEKTGKTTPSAKSPAKEPAAAVPAAKPASTPAAAAVKTPAAKSDTVKTPATRKTTLFFVTIDADGSVIRREVIREIPVTDSPLSEALAALFKGTSSAEAGKGFRSLIPQGTRLLSAVVKDGNATLNVSEEFQFNQFGIEGYLGQLSQIVFTATAFPTVKSVQFLIDGQRKEYLGAEGVWIGTPLTRDKF